MEVKRKNQKLFILVGVLLLFGGVSLAYFASKALTGGAGGETNVTTAVIKGATIKVEGILEFEDLDILPGHKSVSAIKVTATGNNELIPYNLIWRGTNTLTTPLNFTIYKTSESISVTSTCTKKKEIISGSQALFEECNISNLDKLGTEVATGTINKNDSKVELAKDEFITATSTGDIKYYYVILEYPNLDEPQNYDLEGSIDGVVTVEESNTKPDINILAAYVVQDDGTYEETDDIPQSGYQLNSEKSTCSNGTTPGWNVKEHMFYTTNLTKSGTSCYLYFDKYVPPVSASTIIANIQSTAKTTTPDFSQIADTDEGVYAVSDGMYGGTSYYWRGAATTNHVIFANKCWRIIRINGDKTIRLIYSGTPGGTAPNQTCSGNGANSASIAKAGQAYNSSYDRSEYVGWTWAENTQRTLATTNKSNAMVQTESWFDDNNNFTVAQRLQVADGKFCNDRNAASGYSWSSQPSSEFYYAGYDRSGAKSATSVTPILSCSNSGDKYTLKVGAITMDEVIMAGGKWSTANSSHYLYGQNYWTMSPYFWYGSGAYVFFVNGDGSLNYDRVNGATGLRPVINLRSDVTFNSGSDGTQNNPYIVQ